MVTEDVVRVVVVFGTERSVLDVKYGKHAIVMAVGVKDITLLDVSDLRDVDVASQFLSLCPLKLS